jgi:hypothetical protein
VCQARLNPSTTICNNGTADGTFLLVQVVCSVPTDKTIAGMTSSLPLGEYAITSKLKDRAAEQPGLSR